MSKTAQPADANQALFPEQEEPRDFESAMAELEKIVAEMEGGQLTLEASLAAYKRGVALTAYCQKTLDAADMQVKLLENGVLKDYKADGRNV
ncbi:MAG: exodeoxyribonuclease VII small subunit [Pseudomonadota bacterium]